MRNTEEMVRQAAQACLDNPERLLDEVIRRAKTHCRPDYIEERMGINESIPRLVAGKRLPGPTYPPDFGNQETRVDEVTVARGRWIAGFGVYIFPHDKAYYMEQEYGFFLFTGEEHNSIMRELSRYILLDTEDFRNTPLIGTSIVVGLREDSPSPEWNRRAKEKNEEERREVQRSFNLKAERVKEEVDAVRSLYPFLNPRMEYRERLACLEIDFPECACCIFHPIIRDRKSATRLVGKHTYQFIAGRDGRPISRRSGRRGKVILPARGFKPKAGEKWVVSLEDKGRFYIGHPLSAGCT